MLYATLRQRRIHVKNPTTVIQNGVNVDELVLELDDEWASMDSIVAVFTLKYADQEIKKEMLYTFGKSIMVPWECLAHTGRLMVSCTGYCVENEKVMTTMYPDSFWNVVQNGPIAGETPMEPTPSLYDQIIAAAGAANAAAAAATEIGNDLATKRDNGEFNGKNGVTPTVEIGAVWTGAEGSEAQVTNSGTFPNVKLDFVLPRGARGLTGVPGAPGATPYVGENGNWWINGVDTGKPSRGGDGTSVTIEDTLITVGADGNVLSQTLIFSDGTTLEIENGKRGKDGEPGGYYSPSAYVIENEITGAKLLAISFLPSKGGMPPVEGCEVEIPAGGGNGSAVPGADGGYYTPSITQVDANTIRVNFAGSDSDMPEIAAVDVKLPVGPEGDPGKTPHVGDNGNWFVGDEDTGKPSQGNDGEAGRGVVSVSEADTSGYRWTFLYTDGTTETLEFSWLGSYKTSLDEAAEEALSNAARADQEAENARKQTNLALLATDDALSAASRASAAALSANNAASEIRQARDNGEFDGADGTSVAVVSVTESTEDGGTNVVNFSDGKTLNVKNGRAGSAGKNGSDGQPGKDGVDGNGIKTAVLNADYTLTLTFDDGTSYTTPSIRGATGAAGSPGSAGKDGQNGVGIASIQQTTTSTADGGTNVFTVTLDNGQSATFSVKNGSKGSSGRDGSDANVTAANIQSALGYKPANEETVNQLSSDIGNKAGLPVSIMGIADGDAVGFEVTGSVILDAISVSNLVVALQISESKLIMLQFASVKETSESAEVLLQGVDVENNEFVTVQLPTDSNIGTITRTPYLTEFTETDPTVPAWAKAANKPSYSKSEVGLGNVDNVKQYSASNPPPYPVTSVNGKTGAVTLDAAGVGARPSSWTPSASDVGAVPTSRTVNGKALSANISLSASDVGARPSTWMPTAANVGAVALPSSGNGTAGQFAVSDGQGGVTWLSLATWTGGSY